MRREDRKRAGERGVGGGGERGRGRWRGRRRGRGRGRECTGRIIIGQDKVAPPVGRAKRAQWPRRSRALRAVVPKTKVLKIISVV